MKKSKELMADPRFAPAYYHEETHKRDTIVYYRCAVTGWSGAFRIKGRRRG